MMAAEEFLHLPLADAAMPPCSKAAVHNNMSHRMQAHCPTRTTKTSKLPKSQKICCRKESSGWWECRLKAQGLHPKKKRSRTPSHLVCLRFLATSWPSGYSKPLYTALPNKGILFKVSSACSSLRTSWFAGLAGELSR